MGRVREGEEVVDSHRIVVFPALSRPRTRILASFSPNKLSNLDIHSPMLAHWLDSGPQSMGLKRESLLHVEICQARDVPYKTIFV